MSAWERELGALPSPICPCSTERPGRDLLFLGIVLVFVLVLVIEKLEDDDENEDEDEEEQNSSCSRSRLVTILANKIN
jgi:hypothetical protein